jgi:PAS domain S-box-containing protein
MADPEHGDPAGELAGHGAPLVETLVEHVADGIYLVDNAGRVRFANPAAVALLGYERAEELIGRESHATIHHTRPDGTPFPVAECPLLRPYTTGETVRVDEDWFIRRDGSFVPVAYSSAPLEAPGGTAAVVVFRDIGARLRHEQLLRRSEAEQARAAELHASRARLVAAAEEERRRLGRDLHDGAQQRLVQAIISLQLLDGALARDPAEAAELAHAALAAARAAMHDLRELAAGIHPSLLTSRGLAAAVEGLTASAPVPVELAITPQRFAPELEATAYFTVAEALANVAKHARASEARVAARVADGGRTLVLEVDDDGVGGADVRRGSGLRGLGDRLAAVDGRLAVTSPPGGGTHLRAELPLRAGDDRGGGAGDT